MRRMRYLDLGLLSLFVFLVLAVSVQAAARVATIEVKGMV